MRLISPSSYRPAAGKLEDGTGRWGRSGSLLKFGAKMRIIHPGRNPRPDGNGPRPERQL